MRDFRGGCPDFYHEWREDIPLADVDGNVATRIKRAKLKLFAQDQDGQINAWGRNPRPGPVT